MNNLDISQLEAVTQSYAEFDSRKSGLATALGGLMAIVMSLHVISHAMRGLLGSWWPFQATLVFLAPLLWLPLKQILFSLLYRDLGAVRALPEVAYEQRKWHWFFLTALILLSFQTLAVIGLVGGVTSLLSHPESTQLLPARLPALWNTWVWVVTLPWFYLLLMPWWIKGVEEARAYLVLVGQGVLFIGFSFIQEGANVGRGAKGWLIPILLLVQLGVITWALVTIRRGWREHLEYRSLLRSLLAKKGQP